MGNDVKNEIANLRKIPTDEAVDWLLLNYSVENPDYWKALQIIPHLSWRRGDQIRLAKHYLKKIPFANGKVYDIFLSIMSFKVFIKVMEEKLPIKGENIELLLYYLIPALERYAKTDDEYELLHSFVLKIREGDI
ncbi:MULTISPECIES: hypothetical protein [Janthinobacterium]|uniref:Uncharacterized protein n=1 Tax=Janthinobacterium kumbetense TaxID=2950280 RepID=A0ABT0WMG6_9BURK|nr:MULTISPECIES: hypothetical protein [Janthinobacterium]MCM2565250.1 hypothetical protein [Janthinobacterium kumbetense]MDN2676674.1 hypothetical protein [Janthinobacterium sp. SUN033]MDO8064512.1 hypothetical protein [Janthinobacterium sp. SUN206]MDO8070849.1 hypothetical protein [Janthinobacterium sp. SUN176]